MPEYPFDCCDHCGCGEPDGYWETRDGHDDICIHGCNDAWPGWPQDVIDALNRYQQDGRFHPYTCPNRGDGKHRMTRDLGMLEATSRGWVCPDCPYTQDWYVSGSIDVVSDWRSDG